MSAFSSIDGIWRMLDEMALSDPLGYQKFVSEQLKFKPSPLSKPWCRGLLKCTTRDGRPIFVNICEWDLVDAPKSDVDPIPLYCGNAYMVNEEETISIAVHPSVFEQYSFPRDEPNTAKQTLESDHLIALIILYLQSEKNIQTQEGNVMHERKNLPKFTTEWSSRPHGGDDLMLESLSCKKISLTDFATHLPIETKEGICAHPLASTSHVKNKSKLIEEIKPLPRWHLNRMRKNLNTYEYTIQLPAGTRMEDCELDISPNAISLKLKGNRDFPDPFYAQFADPISPHKAKARFAKSTCRLSVVAPIGVDNRHSF